MGTGKFQPGETEYVESRCSCTTCIHMPAQNPGVKLSLATFAADTVKKAGDLQTLDMEELHRPLTTDELLHQYSHLLRYATGVSARHLQFAVQR